jgi:hypothetical protein
MKGLPEPLGKMLGQVFPDITLVKVDNCIKWRDASEGNFPEYFQFEDSIELSTGMFIFGSVVEVKESFVIFEGYISVKEIHWNSIRFTPSSYIDLHFCYSSNMLNGSSKGSP